MNKECEWLIRFCEMPEFSLPFGQITLFFGTEWCWSTSTSTQLFLEMRISQIFRKLNNFVQVTD
jgi:hypothetical protein